MNEETHINSQLVNSEKIETVTLYIPLIRYAGNFWSVSSPCYSKADAIQSVRSMTGIEELKILVHEERYNVETNKQEAL